MVLKLLEIKKFDVYNFDNALRGAGNPINRWDEMDSYYCEVGDYIIGANDIQLAQKLCKAGSDKHSLQQQVASAFPGVFCPRFLSLNFIDDIGLFREGVEPSFGF
jgi:hypothetical protein